MSLGRKSIVIYSSAQNLSSDLCESKVGVQTCKKKGLEKFYNSYFVSRVQSEVFGFFPARQLPV